MSRIQVLVCHFLYWFRMCTLIDAYKKTAIAVAFEPPPIVFILNLIIPPPLREIGLDSIVIENYATTYPHIR